jgi:hypothetical protein
MTVPTSWSPPPGARSLDDAILLMRGGPGAFSPDELRSALPLWLGDAVQAPVIDDIRIARSRAD